MIKKFILPLVINLILAALATWLFIGSVDEKHLTTELRAISAPVRPFMPALSSTRSSLQILIFGVAVLALVNVYKLLKARITGKSTES